MKTIRVPSESILAGLDCAKMQSRGPAPLFASRRSARQRQQNLSSPLYHTWLTPEEYGRRFGLSPDDFTKVADRIVSQGFRIDSTAKSRTYISFTGTAAHVRNTFGTELHCYQVGGKTHFANVREVAIPIELESMVYTLEGLDNFQDERGVRCKPHQTGGNGPHAVTPGDLAVIYNVAPLYKAGINGAGQKIVVVGQSALNLQDVRDFRFAAERTQGAALPRIQGHRVHECPGRSPPRRGVCGRRGSRRLDPLCLRH